MGAVSVVLTDKHYQLAEKLSGTGHTRQYIAKQLKLSSAAFYVRINKDKKLAQALEQGDVEDFQECQSVLRKKGIEGSFQHLGGYMRLRHGTNMQTHQVRQEQSPS